MMKGRFGGIFSSSAAGKSLQNWLARMEKLYGGDAVLAAVVIASASGLRKARRTTRYLQVRGGRSPLGELLQELVVAPDVAKLEDEIVAVSSFLRRRGAGVLFAGSPRYPRRILDVTEEFPVLFYFGNLRLLDRPAVSVVGTRKASKVALEAARKIAAEVVSAGGVVVSGGAIGVDSAAHKAAAESGQTIVVLGSGIERPYPSVNRDLFAKIVRRGGLIISPFSLRSGAQKWHFPHRNRLIAALSPVTVVVQAPKRSGALVTAHLAADFGREVAVFTPHDDSAEWEGNRRLVAEGAHILSSADELFMLLRRGAFAGTIEGDSDAGAVCEEASLENLTEIAGVAESTVKLGGLFAL